MQRYERYLPTAFDESMSILEKMNKLIETQNSLIDVVNTHVEFTSDQLERAFDIIDENLEKQLQQFRDELEEQTTLYEELRDQMYGDLLPDTVKQKLEEWLLNGTIRELIEDSVFPEWVERLQIAENKINNLSISLKDFGAVGDGVTDESGALSEAIAHIKSNGGGTLYIPEGEYYTRESFELPSNIRIKGEGDRSKFVTRNGGIIFRVNATYSNAVNVTKNSLIGDLSISVADTSVFKVGDYIKIVSQRVATSQDDAGEYYIGYPTSHNDAVHFGEFRKISAINSQSGQLFFRAGLTFPDYRTDNSQETHPKALSNAVVQKVNFIEDIVIKDVTFDGNFSNILRLDGVVNAQIEGLRWINAVEGDFVAFRNSLNSEVRNSIVEYTPDHTPSGHHRRNAFKSVSSTNCGFDGVEIHHGTQCVDFSYSPPFDNTGVYPLPDIGAYLKNSKTTFALFNCMTAHQGTINSQITNNMFLHNRQDGIFTRARNAMISGNMVQRGINEDPSIQDLYAGIVVQNDSSVNVRVSNNTIDGFPVGIQTNDNINTRVGVLNLTINDNTVVNANRGIQLRRRSGGTFTGESGVYITGNTFSQFKQTSGKGIEIYDHYFDVYISENIFNCNSDHINSVIYSRGDSGRIFITKNMMLGKLPHRIIWFEDVVDPNITSAQRIYMFKDNMLSNLLRLTPTRLDTGNLSNNFSDVYYGNMVPYDNGNVLIGSPSQRFDRVFTKGGVDQESDITIKENISDIGFGLDFIEKVRPTEYNLIGEDKKSFGLIAQEVEEVLGDSDNRTMLNKGEKYSMVYTEFIPIIIKAIQELNDKIK